MCFSNINYYVGILVELKQEDILEDRLQLLVNVTGAFSPCILTALVGVSGAGKTTLMDVLAGRKTGGFIEGNITISGYPKNQMTFARVSGYCEPNDVHSPCMTVVESLLFSAWLRFALHVDRETQKVWQALLAVRELVLPPTEDIETWLKFASLCRKSGRISQARSTLCKLLQYDPESSPMNSFFHGHPRVILAYLKYQWSLGDDPRRSEAFSRLQGLALQLPSSRSIYSGVSRGPINASNVGIPLLARVYLKLGT